MLGILPENMWQAWNNFVLNHKYGSIYHTSYWFDVLSKTYNVKPIIISNFNREIYSGIPFILHQNPIRGKRLFGVTSAHFANPLVDDQNDFNDLLVFIKNFITKENINYAQLRLTGNFNLSVNEESFVDSNYFTYRLDIKLPYEEIRKKFHKNCILRPLQKAESGNLKVIKSSETKALKDFYRNYEIMRKKNGLLPQPFSFFSNLINKLESNQFIDVFHVLYNDKVISSMINIKYKNTYTYEYGSSELTARQLHPSHLLINHSIKTAINNGYEIFDFGRTDIDNAGLNDFKKRWGGYKLDLKYYYIYNKPHKNLSNSRLQRLAGYIIHQLPFKIYDVFGPTLYKRAFK